MTNTDSKDLIPGADKDVVEGELLDTEPVAGVSKIMQLKKRYDALKRTAERTIEHDSADSTNELFIGEPTTFMPNENMQKMGRLQRGGYKRDELIVISAINSNADIPMRVSGLADNTVVLVNNHLVDPTAVHSLKFGDWVGVEKVIKEPSIYSSDIESPRLFQSKIDSTRGKVGAAIARKLKKAIRKLHKRRH